MDFNRDDDRLRVLDSRLIGLLQRDAYRPNTDITRQLKVGESTVRRRIQLLIRLGYRRCDTATVLRIKKRSFEDGVAEATRATNHHARRGTRSSPAAGHPEIDKRRPRRPT
jgi:DNA-binding IclR family transcriptional regulator